MPPHESILVVNMIETSRALRLVTEKHCFSCKIVTFFHGLHPCKGGKEKEWEDTAEVFLFKNQIVC